MSLGIHASSDGLIYARASRALFVVSRPLTRVKPGRCDAWMAGVDDLLAELEGELGGAGVRPSARLPNYEKRAAPPPAPPRAASLRAGPVGVTVQPPVSIHTQHLPPARLGRGPPPEQVDG